MAVSAPAKPALQTAEDLEHLSAQGYHWKQASEFTRSFLKLVPKTRS